MSTTAPRENPLLAPPALPRPKTIAVIGAGTIGPDIAYYLASTLPDAKLVLVDVVEEALARAKERIAKTADKGVKKGKLKPEDAARITAAVSYTLRYDDLAGADWVLEAATERLELKRKIFTQVESLIRDDAWITSNTSSLPAARLFSHLKHPERATVTHFFAPAFQNPAVEVIRWDKARADVVEALRALFAATGKVPFVTSDALCFMLDRVFDNWCNDAALLLGDATAAEIDTVAHAYVHAGPFEVLNLAHGNPIIVETNTLQMEEGPAYRPARVFESVREWHTVAPGKSVPVADDVAAKVRDRMLGVLFSQSVDILDRGIGAPADLDLGCVLGLGFKKGPLELMRELGEAECQRIFERFARERPGMPQPKRPLPEYQRFSRKVLADEVDGVCVITLRRPQALNALDDEMTDEVLALIKAREGDPKVKGFVLTGYGERAFCAGADIGRLGETLGDAEAAAGFARECSRLLLHLDRMDKPVVAALNGMALGGGLELALRCTALVAHQGASLQLPEVTLGIAPGIGGLVVPYRRWPNAAPVLHDMLASGKRLSAREAKELGVVSALGGSYQEVLRLAQDEVSARAGKPRPSLDKPVQLAPPASGPTKGPGGAALSAEVVGIIRKAIVDAAAKDSLGAALDVGYRAFGASACTAGAREGITAFLEKRKPDFERTG
ncbi:MAG: enoyl-CoA hydratase/isomerase family protein [Deltaproteobacteria bacterium]|nr:enoyl-CoA hydratase/isomerase family protein [Deltaproteobacteria bacterium]